MPDLLANEQTWPTEEEMRGAPDSESQSATRKVKRVPKGTSAYQAAWIFDDDEDDDDDGDVIDEDIDQDGDLDSHMGEDEGGHPRKSIRPSQSHFAAYSISHGNTRDRRDGRGRTRRPE